MLGAAALAPLLFALPWLIKNQLTAGNPLYPILGMSFPEGAPSAFAFNFDDHYGPGKSLLAMLRSPWDLFVLGREFDRRQYMGRMGIWPLVALPGVLYAARDRRQVTLLALACLTGFFLWSGVLLRAVYLLPIWPLIAALSAGGLAALLPERTAAARTFAITVLALALGASVSGELAPAWRDQIQSVAVVVGEESEADYTLRHRPVDHALRWLRRNSTEQEGVAQFWSWHWWDLPNRRIWGGAEDFTPLRSQLLKLGSPEAILAELQRLDVRWVLYQHPVLLRGSYPSVTDSDWQAGFVAPQSLADKLVHDHLLLRYEHGPYQVYEVPSGTEDSLLQPGH
jgi:hypothetical protein